MKAIASRKCGLKHISAILYCASQNQVKIKLFIAEILFDQMALIVKTMGVKMAKS